LGELRVDIAAPFPSSSGHKTGTDQAASSSQSLMRHFGQRSSLWLNKHFQTFQLQSFWPL
jgi:hypothetical protein